MTQQPPKRKNKSRKAYPNNVLQVSNLVLVGKSVGIERNAIEDDVEYLLYQFVSRPTQTFEDFEIVWNELHFSHVHFACLKRDYRDRYMNAFFASFLDYFKSELVSIQCGVLFSLYFLYMSQPSIWGKNRIRVTKDIYNDLFKFYVESIQKDKNEEAALIFDKLRNMQAFLFVAEQEPETRYTYEKVEFENAINLHKDLQALKSKKITNDPIHLCSNKDMEEYEQLASLYQSSKNEVFYTKQATKATQAMFKEKANVIEKRPRLLQNVMMNSTLAQEESDTIELIHQSSEQMLQLKRRKLTEERERHKK